MQDDRWPQKDASKPSYDTDVSKIERDSRTVGCHPRSAAALANS